MSEAPFSVSCDLSRIFSIEGLHSLLKDESYESIEENVCKCAFPDFGANGLQRSALTHLCSELRGCVHQTVSAVNHVPSVLVADGMCSVWEKLVDACIKDFYSERNIRQALADLKKDDNVEASTQARTLELVPYQAPESKTTGNTILIEMGVKTGLSVVFALLKQAWAQVAWQRQLEQALQQSGALSLGPAPIVNLPNEVLKSVLAVLALVPPLSLSNPKTVSSLGQQCLVQCGDFLQWVISPPSLVDLEGKRLALQITLALCMQQGSLIHLLEWVEDVLVMLVSYKDAVSSVARPSLDLATCKSVLSEIRVRTVCSTRL